VDDELPAEIIAAVVHRCALAGCTCVPFVDVLELIDKQRGSSVLGHVIEIVHADDCASATKTERMAKWN
jgi:hypothetical protein